MADNEVFRLLGGLRELFFLCMRAVCPCGCVLAALPPHIEAILRVCHIGLFFDPVFGQFLDKFQGHLRVPSWLQIPTFLGFVFEEILNTFVSERWHNCPCIS